MLSGLSTSGFNENQNLFFYLPVFSKSLNQYQMLSFRTSHWENYTCYLHFYVRNNTHYGDHNRFPSRRYLQLNNISTVLDFFFFAISLFFFFFFFFFYHYASTNKTFKFERYPIVNYFMHYLINLIF